MFYNIMGLCPVSLLHLSPLVVLLCMAGLQNMKSGAFNKNVNVVYFHSFCKVLILL